MEFNMAPLQTYLDDFGDTDKTRLIYYKTFFISNRLYCIKNCRV